MHNLGIDRLRVNARRMGRGKPQFDTRWALVLLAPVLIAAGLAGCGGGESPGTAAAGTSAATKPEPPAAPAAHVVSLAPPTTATTKPSSSSVEQIAKVASQSKDLEAALRSASFDGSAANPLVVQGGGRQTEVARPAQPRHHRWEIRFTAGSSIESYARQLDSFHIELGAIGGNSEVTYLTNLANPKPTTRTGPAASDQRLYLIWQRGAMREADEQIAQRAGIDIQDKVLAHFIPQEVEDELLRLEDSFARQLNIAKIGKTVFGIRVAGQDSFRFYVIEQKADLR
jgi:hypothetical protein